MEIQKNQMKAWLYLLPTIILMLIFTIWPLFSTIAMSFMDDYHRVTRTFSAINLENYRAAMTNPLIIGYFINTFIIVFISVPLSVIIALLIAVALNSIKKFNSVFQTIFFLPYVTNTIAIGMVFGVMFSTQGGLVNTILDALGMEPVNWLGGQIFNSAEVALYPSKANSMFILITYIVWNALPFKILILLSGLQSVDKQYYQAAQIDGASRSKILWRITVPLLSPQIAYLATTSFIGAFKEYTSIVAIFGDDAGPLGYSKSMGTVVYYIYDEMSQQNIAHAAAAATTLFMIILVFTALNLWVSKKRVHY